MDAGGAQPVRRRPLGEKGSEQRRQIEQDWKNRYLNGATVRDLARETGYEVSTVRLVLRWAGLNVPVSDEVRVTPRRGTQEWNDLVAGLVRDYRADEKPSTYELGNRYGVSRQWVAHVLREQGIELRGRDNTALRGPGEMPAPGTLEREVLAERLRREYEANQDLSAADLAERYPYSFRGIYKLLHEAGTAMRSAHSRPGEHRIELPVPGTPERRVLAERLRREYEANQDLSVADLAGKYPYSYTGITKLLHEAGTAMRSAHRRSGDVRGERIVEITYAYSVLKKSIGQLALENGLTDSQVKYLLKKAGIRIRSAAEQREIDRVRAGEVREEFEAARGRAGFDQEREVDRLASEHDSPQADQAGSSGVRQSSGRGALLAKWRLFFGRRGEGDVTGTVFGKKMSFSAEDVESTALRNADGKTVGVTFHSESKDRDSSLKWAQTGGSAGLPVGENSFVINTHGRGKSFEVTLTNGARVRVDGSNFAKIVEQSAAFREAGSASDSYVLLACSAGKLDQRGGAAFDFQRMFSLDGRKAQVYAPTQDVVIGNPKSGPTTKLLKHGEWRRFDDRGMHSNSGFESAHTLAGLGVSTVRLDKIRSEFEQLATGGALEDYSREISGAPGIREALAVIEEHIGRLPEPDRSRLRAWIDDAVHAASLVPVRETADGAPTELDHTAMRQRHEIRTLTPDRLEEALEEIATRLQADLNPFTVPFSDLAGSAYDPAASLTRRLVEVSLINLTFDAQLKLRQDELFQKLLENEYALVDSLFAAGGHEEQFFLATCGTAAVNSEMLAKVPTVAGMLLVGREFSAHIRGLIEYPQPQWAHVLDERDQFFGRTIRELVARRVEEADAAFEQLRERALELAGADRRAPEEWVTLSREWGRVMQKLSVLVELGTGQRKEIQVLTRRLLPGRWNQSFAVSALLMLVDRPFRRFAGVNDVTYRKVLNRTVYDRGRKSREADFTGWHDELGADECWNQIRRSGGAQLGLLLHTLRVDAVQRDGKRAYVLYDPGKNHPDHYTPEAFLEWAGKNNARITLVDPPARPHRADVGEVQRPPAKWKELLEESCAAEKITGLTLDHEEVGFSPEAVQIMRLWDNSERLIGVSFMSRESSFELSSKWACSGGENG
ncbi:hypothetical protein [Saccharopolyspora shandongensis]|uniref:hypothetical protein n=1 Tax=Saccharopolyspora shandongensis TaxID=418495 RepID=UPI0033EBE429